MYDEKMDEFELLSSLKLKNLKSIINEKYIPYKSQQLTLIDDK